jgi:hypothetical protein
VSDGDPPEGEGAAVRDISDKRVGALLAGVQRLIDSRPAGGYPIEWCIQAEHLGDMTAIAAVTIAARSVRTPA